jgi:hypothetical protein
MRPLSLLLLVLALCVPWHVHAQDTEPPEGAIVESVDVRGLPLANLSSGLSRELDMLRGEKLDRKRLADLALRIEAERPESVAAVRTAASPDGRARVIFLIVSISDDGSLVENINARYTVESVEIRGVPEAEISQSLRNRLQTLVGKRLDHDEADELSDDLEAERPGYSVERRISRGSERGRIRVVFEFSEKERPRWIPFTPSRSKFVYHSDQGWSGALDIPMGNRNHRVTAGFAFSNNDDLIEEYSGVRVGFESRRLATDRLGARVEVARFNDSWRAPTLVALAADPSIPEAYRSRITVEPSVTVALTPYVRVTGGASISELESLDRAPESQMASAFVTRVDYDQRWFESDDVSQRLTASYELRSATGSLESDLIYKRHLGRARYRFSQRRSTVIADLAFGRITGDAPLFERFALGDTSTLRGWNRYDLTPVGGTRVFHGSLEYRFGPGGVFLDTGSVWDQNAEKRIRFSSGFGLQGDNGFLNLAFPLNTDDLNVTFTMGVRF